MSNVNIIDNAPAAPAYRPIEMTYHDLLELAIEALNRANMNNSPGHPEDLASHIIPAIEAVAIGFSAGNSYARNGHA